MISLSNYGGDSLQIWIDSYQFPDPGGYYWDLNWLCMNVRWQRAEAVWQASDSCLSTEELLDLFDWFKHGEQAKESIDFMEPCLKFSRLTENGMPKLRVYLKHELHPGKTLNLPSILQSVTKMNNDLNQENSFWLEFPLTVDNTSNLLIALQEMIDQFPVRHENT